MQRDFVRRIDTSASRSRRLHIDLPLLALLALLATIGLLVLASAAGDQLSYLKRQSVFLLVGTVVMVAVAQFPLRFWERWTIAFYLAGIILLGLVLLVGVGAKGAQRWLDLGVVRIQPSELMKLSVPMMVASFFHHRAIPPTALEVFIALVLTAIPAALILVQPDLGTALLIFSSGLFALFLAGVAKRYIVGAVGVAIVSAPLAWLYLLHDYQRQRIVTLFDPSSDALGSGWNIIQSQIAIGSGGLAGKGWRQGTQSQLDFLPESHTDFIIAVLAEEFGLIGVLVLLTVYLLLILRIGLIAANAASVFGKLVAGSMALTLFVYVFVNMGMVAGILPVVGVPLPFVSYGGTAVLTLLFGFGILMAIATDKAKN